MSRPLAKLFDEREEWLAARRKTLGGSDVPAALFNEGHRSALAVQYDKLGEGPPFFPSYRFRMGLAAEPVISEQAEESLGMPVVEPSKTGPVIYYNDQCPALHATPDRFVLPERPVRVHAQTLPQRATKVLSLKSWTASRRDMWTDHPPLYALIQLMTEMLITGVHVGSIAVSFGLCEDFQIYPEIEYHEALGEQIRNEAPIWWQRHIVNREQVQAVAADQDLLKQLYPTATPGSIVVLSGEPWAKAYADLQLAKAQAKLAEEVKDTMEAKFKQAMGDAEIAVISDTEALSWKTQVRHDAPQEAQTYSLRVFRQVRPSKEVLDAIKSRDLESGLSEIGEPLLALSGDVGSDGTGAVEPATPAAGDPERASD